MTTCLACCSVSVLFCYSCVFLTRRCYGTGFRHLWAVFLSLSLSAMVDRPTVSRVPSYWLPAVSRLIEFAYKCRIDGQALNLQYSFHFLLVRILVPLPFPFSSHIHDLVLFIHTLLLIAWFNHMPDTWGSVLWGQVFLASSWAYGGLYMT